MASALLSQASELNEDGIYELSSGRPGVAIGHLQEAAEKLMQCFPLASTTIASAEPSLALNSPCRIQIPHLEDAIFYIYACAASYTPPCNAPAVSQKDLVFGMAVILFNCALAHHQQYFISKRNSKEENLSQALKFYKECHQALQSLHSSTNNEDDLLLMTLACLNNQAQILYELMATEGDSVFQKLLTCSIQAAQDQNSPLSMMEHSQIHEFVQNAMVFRLQRPNVAPSA